MAIVLPAQLTPTGRASLLGFGVEDSEFRLSKFVMNVLAYLRTTVQSKTVIKAQTNLQFAQCVDAVAHVSGYSVEVARRLTLAHSITCPEAMVSCVMKMPAITRTGQPRASASPITAKLANARSQHDASQSMKPNPPVKHPLSTPKRMTLLIITSVLSRPFFIFSSWKLCDQTPPSMIRQGDGPTRSSKQRS